MTVVSVPVEKNGRILIPVEIRRRLGLKEGESTVVLHIDDTGVIGVTTREQALHRIQAALNERLGPERSLADELIADRRKEATRENHT